MCNFPCSGVFVVGCQRCLVSVYLCCRSRERSALKAAAISSEVLTTILFWAVTLRWHLRNDNTGHTGLVTCNGCSLRNGAGFWTVPALLDAIRTNLWCVSICISTNTRMYSNYLNTLASVVSVKWNNHPLRKRWWLVHVSKLHVLCNWICESQFIAELVVCGVYQCQLQFKARTSEILSNFWWFSIGSWNVMLK